MEKNYIEQVTNLERKKEKYVPKRLFDHLISDYQAEHSFEGLEEDAEFDNKIFTMIEQAEKESRELFVLEEPEKKRDLETCPYCSGRMEMQVLISGNQSKVYFECNTCHAHSPNVYIKKDHFDSNKVKEDIENDIQWAIDEVKREESEKNEE